MFKVQCVIVGSFKVSVLCQLACVTKLDMVVIKAVADKMEHFRVWLLYLKVFSASVECKTINDLDV